MATTSGMYSGLLQTSGELARAEEAFAGAASKGLEEGAKPLQGYLMGVAAKEQERLDQLKADQGSAIDYMNTMADTSGLLGEFEGPIAQFAIETKNKLNEIAKNESLGQYEKAAAYKEAVDAFNKKAMSFSGDQESIANMNKLLVNGNLSGSVDPSSREYQIIKGMGLGEYKINPDGSYNVNGIKVTSAELKALTLPEKQYDPIKVQGAINKIAQSTTDPKQLEKNIAAATLQYTVSEKVAREFLTDGLNYTNKELEGKDLTSMSDMIKTHMETKAKEVFYKALPAAIPLSDGEVMGANAFNDLKLAAETGRFEILNGVEYGEGGVVQNVTKLANDLINITYIKDGEIFEDTKKLNSGTFLDLGNRLIKKIDATPTESLKAYNSLQKLLNTPPDPKKKDDDDNINMGIFENNIKTTPVDSQDIKDTLSDIKKANAKKDALDVGLGNKKDIKPELNIRKQSSIPRFNPSITKIIN